MTPGLVDQETRVPRNVRAHIPPVGIVALAIVLVLVGAGIGVGGTVLARALKKQSITDIAVGTWSCARSGGDEGDRPVKTVVFIGKTTWAAVEVDGGARFHEGGTWKLADGRLVVESSEASYTFEEVPQDLSSNKALKLKQSRLGLDRGTPHESSATYKDGVLTFRYDNFNFRCTKDGQ